uniref:Leucine-rich repeat protein n=1 Tax=Paramoeba aestuarina TaxID=180227 RepID=A0A7S4JQ01_9EUKA|mmetsp:Transcript_12187/g.18598  ORF Transcript_12187/g.18598 Transcript_12187/m.18598 type:complete len:259 (+) Transcript_12187:28-804(+)
MLLTSVVCADSLARVDKESMSQQTLCELFVAEMNRKVAFYETSSEDFRPISDWQGVTVDFDDTVSSIEWKSCENRFAQGHPNEVGGTINLQWLPSTVTELIAEFLELCGTIDTADLPRGLLTLSLCDNALSGTFDVKGLPQDIQTVNLFSNKLSGCLDLEALPPKLQSLNAGGNMFHGSLDLTCLPEPLYALWLHANRFDGTINLENLSTNLWFLNLSENNLSQKEVRVGRSVDEFASFEIDWDKFESVLDINGEQMR